MLRFCPLIVLLVMAAGASHARSCSQMRPCAYLRPESVVFIGTVTNGVDLAKPENDIWEGQTRRVQVTVSEIFAGLPKGTREIAIETGSWILDGHDYLFDAKRSKAGALFLGTCGFTREVNNQDEFVRYFRARRKGTEPTTLTVHVFSRAVMSIESIEGAEVTIRGPEGQRRATTNHDGGAVFDGVAAGAYAVSASKPLFRSDTGSIQQDHVEVLDQTCAASSLYLSAENLVSGVLRMADGKPAAHIEVELLGVNPERERAGYSPTSYTAVTGGDGAFRFGKVFPGWYLLGTGISFPEQVTSPVMIAYYPGQRTREKAVQILIEAGSDVEGLQFTLPDIGAPRLIRIRVVDERGSPVAGAKVSDGDLDLLGKTDGYASVGEGLITGPDGWLDVQGFEGARYVVGASSGKWRIDLRVSEHAEIAPGKGPVSVRLVVR